MNSSFLLFLTLAICYKNLSALTIPRNESYCYSKDSSRPQVTHFASKTAYQVVKGTTFIDDVIVPNCKPVKFWLLSRHGTRLPGDGHIEDLPDLEVMRDKIVKNYKKPVEGGLCDEDLELIKNWVVDKNITVDKAEYLVPQGWNDLKIMAQDYKKALPDLLSVYDENTFLFRHTTTQRTQESYKAFAEGLFGPNAYEKVTVTTSNGKDTLLKPYNYCDDKIDHDDDKKSGDTESGKFKKSDIMTDSLKRISARLGFKKTLKYKKVKQLLDMCRFESAWYIGKPSAWCAVFAMEDVLVFEYLDDLGKEYKNGYSTDLNPNIPCELMQDMLARLQSNDGPNVVAYFSHSSLIQLFATSLGIQKDSTLLTSAGYNNSANRKWRTSELDPFAANYAVVKYDCSEDTADPSLKIRFFSNQHPIDFQGCPNGLCKLSDFIAKYQKYSDVNCENAFCKSKKL